MSQLAIYFYPKDQKPAYRTFLTAFPATLGSAGAAIWILRRIRWPRPKVIRRCGRRRVWKTSSRICTCAAKPCCLEAILPDGTRRTLSYVDHFSFNWMTNYIYADDAAPVLPKGTLIHVVAWHDNTANNPNNPDPEQWVGWGQRTVDEMAHAWVNVTYITDDDYQTWLAKQSRAGVAAK